MVTVGADTHAASHTFVAVDDNGRQVAQRTVAATSSGHLEVLSWAAHWPERRWAIEDCRLARVSACLQPGLRARQMKFSVQIAWRLPVSI